MPEIAEVLNIGQAAAASGVSAKMIRHYEEIGLMGGVPRTGSGYRLYRDTDIHTLRFIRRARDLGFSIEQIRELLGLWRNRRRSSAEVKRLASARLAEIDERIARLQAMRRTLASLMHDCHGDARPDCPILEDLGEGR
jgi:MerR family transcriptional regulator, copper efflux regulator